MNVESYIPFGSPSDVRQVIANAFIDLIIKTTFASILDITDIILTGL